MDERKKEDLRTKKTKNAIRTVFRDMLSEMNYDEIKIKELTERAEISRRTFYMHYSALDELLNELIDEIADNYTRKTNALHGHYEHATHLGASNRYEKGLLIAYLNESALGMYRRWVSDKKQLPLEDFVDFATRLICHGAAGFREQG